MQTEYIKKVHRNTSRYDGQDCKVCMCLSHKIIDTEGSDVVTLLELECFLYSFNSFSPDHNDLQGRNATSTTKSKFKARKIRDIVTLRLMVKRGDYLEIVFSNNADDCEIDSV